MRNIWLLSKILLKVQLQGAFNSTKLNGSTKKKPSKGGKIATGIAYVILFGYLVALFTFLFDGINTTALSFGLTELPVTILLIMVVSIGLFFMVLAMISTLYYDQTTSILLPLPLSATEILIARSIVLFVDISLIVILIGIGPLVVTIIRLGLTIVEVILLIIMMTTISIIPSCILGILLMILMRYSRIFYNKKRVQLVGFLGLFFIYFVFISFLGSTTPDMEETTNTVAMLSSVSATMGMFYPPIRLAINAIMASSWINGLTNLLLYVGLTILVVLIYLKIGRSIYLKGLVASMLNGGKQKKGKIKDHLFKPHHPIHGYVLKEIHTIFSSATYLIQMVTPVYLVGVIIIISFGISIAQLEGDIFAVIHALRDLDVDQWIDFGICAMLLFITSMDYSANVMISKDGHCASWMRTIPMSALDQGIGKLITSMLIRLPLIIIVTVICPVIGVVSPLSAITIFIILIAHMFVCDVFGLWNDARKPYLTWTSEIQAVKNNTKVFVGMLFNLLVALIIGGLYYFCVTLIQPTLMINGVMMVISLIFIGISVWIFTKTGPHLLDHVH